VGQVVGGVVVGPEVNGRNGSFRMPMKRFGKNARVRMAKKIRVEFVVDG